MAMGMLLFAFFGIFDSLVNLKIIDKGFLIIIISKSRAILQFFDRQKYFNYIKTFLSYIFGLIRYTVAVLAIGYLTDLLVYKFQEKLNLFKKLIG